MTLVKFNRKPFEGSFNNFVDDLFTNFPVYTKNDGDQALGFAPVNIKETEKNYNIEIVAPGFDKADFKVSVDEQILTISAEKKNEVKEDASASLSTEKQIRKEYSYRSFKRSFTLDEKTDVNGIDAKYVNGVLTLNLPKKVEVKTPVQQINIQ